MAWLVWIGVIVDEFEGGRRSVPSSLLRFYPACCVGTPPCCCVCASVVEEITLGVRFLPKAPP